MAKTSIIIPARAEKYENLKRTIDSIRANATGDYEIIVGFNGSPYYDFPDVITVKLPRDVGIKNNINMLCAMAEGKYVYKSDAHCAFGKGFDEILQVDIQEDWIVMPRFKIIKDDWSIQIRDGQEEFYDYFFMHCPLTDKRGYRFKAAGHWPERTQERLISHPGMDETPSIHGSGWFISREYFLNELGGFPIIDPYGHGQEAQWLSLRNWLKGGKTMVNKKTWMAHLHQDGSVKGYRYTSEEERHTYKITAEHFMFNREPNMKYNIEWYVDTKFPNMPTWPENWQELQSQYKKENNL